MCSIDFCHPKPRRPGPVLSALALCRTAVSFEMSLRSVRGSQRFTTPGTATAGSIALLWGVWPRDRSSICAADTPSPRRLRTRPSRGRWRIHRGRGRFPALPVKAERLSRPGVPSLGSRSRFPSCDGSRPRSGWRPRERPAPPFGQRRSGFSRPFAPGAAGEGGLVEASPAVCTTRPCGAGDARRRGHDCDSESLQHETRRTGHHRRALRSSPARDRRPCPLSRQLGASRRSPCGARLVRCRQRLESHLLCVRSRERPSPLGPRRSDPFGAGGDGIALALRCHGHEGNAHGFVRSRPPAI